jgi:hypothetical protein
LLSGTDPGGRVPGDAVPGDAGPGDAALGFAASGDPRPWRVTASSRSAAAASCSARGRDTSRARIAEVGVIFIPDMRLSIGAKISDR